MEWKDDFANEEVVDLRIKDRPGFRYRPVTAGDENDWLGQYVTLGEDGKTVHDFAALNKCKLLNNLIDVPYSKSEIKEMIGVDCEWKMLIMDDKWKLLRKLKAKFFSSLIIAMAKIDSGDKLKN